MESKGAQRNVVKKKNLVDEIIDEVVYIVKSVEKEFEIPKKPVEKVKAKLREWYK